MSNDYYNVKLSGAATLHLLAQPQQHPVVRLPRLDATAELRRIRVQGCGGALVSLSQQDCTQRDPGAIGGAPVHIHVSSTRECRLCRTQNHIGAQCPILEVVLEVAAGPPLQQTAGGEKSDCFEASMWLSRVPQRTLDTMVAIKNLASLQCAGGTGSSFGNKVHACECILLVH